MTKRRILIGSLLALIAVGLIAAAPPVADPQPSADGEEAAPENGPAREQARKTRRGNPVSVFGEEIRVPAGVEQRGDIVSVGADVVIEGRVRGDVFVIGGKLELTGYVDGGVVGVLSHLSLHDAEIEDQLVNVAGTLEQEGSVIGGQQVNLGFGEGALTLARPLGVLGAVLFWGRLLRVLIVFVILLLLVAIVPDRVRTISEETPKRLFAAFFVGLLGYLGLWIAIALLSITIVGIFLALFLFILLKWLGIAGMFHFFGHRLGRSLGWEFSLLGAVLLGFAPFVALVLLPSAFGLPGLIVAALFWMVIWIFLEIPAVGLVILTRGGNLPARSGPPQPVAATPAVSTPVPGAAAPPVPEAPPGADTGGTGKEEPGEPAPPAP
jgi:hypothetical protein